MNPEQLQHWRTQVARFLDGHHSEGDTRQLNEDLRGSAELRREFAILARQEVQLRELAAEFNVAHSSSRLGSPEFPNRAATVRERPTPASRAVPIFRSRSARIPALAACLMLLAALVFWLAQKPAADAAFRFTHINGEVWVERSDVKRRAALTTTLQPGDQVQTAFGADAVIDFLHEETRLTLHEETTLVLPFSGRKQFTLEQGSFTAKVAPQPRGEPLIFTTPEGTSKVLGTEFLLASDAASTHLSVKEGRVELRRRADGAVIEVSAQQVAVAAEGVPLTARALPADGQGTGLPGEYFGGRKFGTPTVQRLDPRVQFDWGRERPVPGLNIDHFQIRWTGAVQPRFTERYVFELVADDGVRLWVDGRLLIDQWDIRSRQTRMRSDIALVAGRKYDLKLEYFEASEKAFISLYWQSDSQPREIVPTTQLYPPADFLRGKPPR